MLSVRIPPTRQDVLHPCDIAEDVAIAYGYDRVEESLPTTFTMVTDQPLNRLTDMIRAEIALCGFTEALTFSLVSSLLPSFPRILSHAFRMDAMVLREPARLKSLPPLSPICDVIHYFLICILI